MPFFGVLQGLPVWLLSDKESSLALGNSVIVIFPRNAVSSLLENGLEKSGSTEFMEKNEKLRLDYSGVNFIIFGHQRSAAVVDMKCNSIQFNSIQFYS